MMVGKRYDTMIHELPEQQWVEQKNTPGMAPGGVLLSPMQVVAIDDSVPHRLPIKAQRAMDQLPAFTNLRITSTSSPCILMKYNPGGKPFIGMATVVWPAYI